jgi:hypothetical protein
VDDLREQATQAGRWPALSGPASAFFGTLSSLLGRRVFHPQGKLFRATVLLDEPSALRASLGGRGPLEAVIRFSRGAGFPEPIPDVLGISLKIHGLRRHDAVQDFLLVSSGPTPLFGRLLLPATGFLGRPFSSVLPFRIGSTVLLVGALPERGLRRHDAGGFTEVETLAREGSLRYQLALGRTLGEWRPVGAIEVGRPIGGGEAADLRFDPWNCVDGVQPVGLLNGLRRAVYPTSQAARGEEAAGSGGVGHVVAEARSEHGAV